MRIFPACGLAFVVVCASARADDWPQFRGPGGKGVSAGKDAPLEWGPDRNVRWRTELPGAGNSSPIVSGGRVFVTAAADNGRKRSLVCLDRKTGRILWTRTVPFDGKEPTQKANPYCGSTPCADGERVVVWHSSAGLHCYDLDGKPLWKRDLGVFDHMWGYGSSPILLGDRVILNAGPGDRSRLVALDKKSGRTLWTHEEAGGNSKKWLGSWSTPVVAGGSVIVPYPGHVKGFDPATGKPLWTCGGFSELAYADVALGDGVAVATGEDEGGASIAFRLGGKGDVTETHRLWAKKRALEVSTGLILDGRLWSVDNDGVLRCTDVKTGEDLLKERFPGGAAWGSMVLAAGRIYVTARSGDTVVFRPDPKGIKVLATNRLGERSNATPAFSDGEIFLRTAKAAYCVSTGR